MNWKQRAGPGGERSREPGEAPSYFSPLQKVGERIAHRGFAPLGAISRTRFYAFPKMLLLKTRQAREKCETLL